MIAQIALITLLIYVVINCIEDAWNIINDKIIINIILLSSQIAEKLFQSNSPTISFDKNESLRISDLGLNRKNVMKRIIKMIYQSINFFFSSSSLKNKSFIFIKCNNNIIIYCYMTFIFFFSLFHQLRLWIWLWLIALNENSFSWLLMLVFLKPVYFVFRWSVCHNTQISIFIQ